MFEKVKKVTSKLIYAVPVAIFLAFVFYFAAMTYTEEKPGTIKGTIEETKFNFSSYVELSKKFEVVLQENVFDKYRFINLNGRIAKYLGFNSLNHVQKLANGHLTRFSRIKNVSESAKRVIELNIFLSERQIPFLFVIAPDKNSIYDVKFAPGYGDESKRNIGNMVSLLDKAGVCNLNMDSWFKENGWSFEDVFFKTDHHWLPRAGLAAARCTMELLEQQGIAEYDKEKLQEGNYTVKVLKKWFLGSAGKRTGRYYAGVDDFPVYSPKFKAEYSFSRLDRNDTKWISGTNILRLDILDKKDYYRTNPYAMYMYGDFALSLVKNAAAVGRKRLLIIGDSFANVWHYFMTTQFSEIYRVDLRHYKDGSLAQYIEENKPDIVIMCISENSLSDSVMYKFGIADYLQNLAKSREEDPPFKSAEIELGAKVEKENFAVVVDNLNPGHTYTLTVGKVGTLGRKENYVQMTLKNLSSNEDELNHYFEVNRENKQKWIFSVPNKANSYAIYLYAGTKRHTSGISVKVSEVLLRNGIYED